MIIPSKYSIHIPPVDVCSYVFDPTTPKTGVSVFISADHPTHKFTKSELETVVRRIGQGLRKVGGLHDEDVVFMCAENSIWYPAVALGTLCAGGIFTGANPAYAIAELIHQLEVSSAKLVFADRERLPIILEAAKAVSIPKECIFLVDGDTLASSTKGYQCLSSLLTHGERQWERVDDLDVVSRRIAVLNFSSGTTGPPKACMVTHHNIVSNAEQTSHLDRMARARQSDPQYATRDVHVAYVPLYHAMGLLNFCIVNVKRDCTTVIMAKFSLALLLHAIQRFRITYLLLVPPVAVSLIKSPLARQYDLSSIKFLLCCAAPLGNDTSKQLEGIFKGNGVRSRQGWGMTEATMAITLFAPDEFDPTHAGVGYLVANMQAKIVNDEGKEVGYGEEGEALIRGPNVFRGYYKNPTATKEAWTQDGWLKTGDYVVVQENGLFSVVDRKKELIKVKGFQVSPSELEAHLLECDKVKDCAVIRVVRDGQEHPQAHIVPNGNGVTARSILDFIEKRLSAQKRLTGGVVFIDRIPKSPSGKILRRMLKDPYKAQVIYHGSSL